MRFATGDSTHTQWADAIVRSVQFHISEADWQSF